MPRQSSALRAALLFLAATIGAPSLVRAQRAIPTPASILGFEPGADRHLPSWKQITDYFTALDKASPRVSVADARQDDARPAVHRRVHLRLEHARQSRALPADPAQAHGSAPSGRRRTPEAHRRRQERHPRHVGIHSTEVGRIHHAARPRRPAGARAGSRGAARSSRTRSSCSCRHRIPMAWTSSATTTARRSARRPKGRDPPDLYHKYAGHDDNRDWYAFTQPETRYTVDSLYTPWDPQIVNDIHQQGVERGPHLHSAVHGSGRAEHRSDSHRRRRTASGMAIVWRMTESGIHRHRAATRRTISGRPRGSIRSTIAARACSPRRRARVSRRRSTFRSISSAPAAATTRRRCRGIFRRCGRAATGRTATSCAIRPRRAGRCSSTPRDEPPRVARGLRGAGRSRARRASGVGDATRGRRRS